MLKNRRELIDSARQQLRLPATGFRRGFKAWLRNGARTQSQNRHGAAGNVAGNAVNGNAVNGDGDGVVDDLSDPRCPVASLAPNIREYLSPAVPTDFMPEIERRGGGGGGERQDVLYAEWMRSEKAKLGKDHLLWCLKWVQKQLGEALKCLADADIELEKGKTAEQHYLMGRIEVAANFKELRGKKTTQLIAIVDAMKLNEVV